MSFKATLNVDSKEIRLLNINYDFSQPTSHRSSQPSGEVTLGSIHMSALVTKDSTLLQWMLANGEEKDGSIIFHKRKDNSTWREIQFHRAHLVNYSESFSDGSELMCDFTLISPQIDIGDDVNYEAPVTEQFED